MKDFFPRSAPSCGARKPGHPVLVIREDKVGAVGQVTARDQSGVFEQAIDQCALLGVLDPLAVDQWLYEIACDEVPYTRYSPWEVLQVQEARRRRMEELKCLMGESR